VLLLLLHDVLRPDRLPAALVDVGAGHVLKVVDVVQECGLELVDGGLDVARDADVDQEQRAPAPLLERAAHARYVDQGLAPADAGEDDVGLSQQLLQLVEPVRARREAPGELIGVRAGAIRNADLRQPLTLERDERALDHLARSHEQGRLAGEILEDLRGQIDGDACDRHRTLGDARLVDDALGGRKGPLEEARQDRSTGTRLDCDPVGVLQLPQDLGLADDHRVDRGCHPKDVPDGIAVGVLVDEVVECASREQPVAAAGANRLGQRAHQAQTRSLGLMGRDHQLDTVAGRYDHGLVDLVTRDELLEHGRRVVDREALAHVERRAAVVHAEEQDLHTRSPTPTTANTRKKKPASALAAACLAP